ncbi:GPO family capsid scaffolding protein [Novosphingobium rosa]|uniref:GPO family capsid scaffolding protein n=1 Tax=Novosphingobium rosa TaxID=76978 RepID=UPI000832EBB9|nr:GPO family capsid scaffolding protein [Novosphingobium rosa]
MPKSRFFRVATEGATTDGRQIEGLWLTQMAKNYNTTTYTAVVNMEHVRGITADPPFQSLGKVLSLKTENVDLTIGGKVETRLALYAEIDAHDTLVAMNKAGQKLFTSIEVNPKFADSGEAYLVGLAVTDSPASLGTELLQFCAGKGDASPLAHRKKDKDNLFTAAAETTLEFEDISIGNDDDASALQKLLGVFQKALGLHSEQPQKVEKAKVTIDATAMSAEHQAAITEALAKMDVVPEFTNATITPPSQGNSGQQPANLAALFADPIVLTALTGFMGKFDKAFATIAANTAATDKAVKDLTTRVESIPNANFKQRSPATGTPQVEVTDC